MHKKKNINCWWLWFLLGTNLASKLKTKKNDVLVADNLGVNNLKSPRDPTIVNQKMYDAIHDENRDY